MHLGHSGDQHRFYTYRFFPTRCGPPLQPSPPAPLTSEGVSSSAAPPPLFLLLLGFERRRQREPVVVTDEDAHVAVAGGRTSD